MPRKRKIESEQPTGEGAGETPPQPSAMPPRAVRKVAKKSGSRTAAAKKRNATRAKADESQPPQRREPTDDEVRLRAYFIAERRVQMGIPGSETDDWVEARRQLEAELGW